MKRRDDAHPSSTTTRSHPFPNTTKMSITHAPPLSLSVPRLFLKSPPVRRLNALLRIHSLAVIPSSSSASSPSSLLAPTTLLPFSAFSTTESSGRAKYTRLYLVSPS